MRAEYRNGKMVLTHDGQVLEIGVEEFCEWMSKDRKKEVAEAVRSYLVDISFVKMHQKEADNLWLRETEKEIFGDFDEKAVVIEVLSLCESK